jgi:hypothetical protein
MNCSISGMLGAKHYLENSLVHVDTKTVHKILKNTLWDPHMKVQKSQKQ